MGWICIFVFLCVVAICDMVENIFRYKYNQTNIKNITINVEDKEISKKKALKERDNQ